MLHRDLILNTTSPLSNTINNPLEIHTRSILYIVGYRRLDTYRRFSRCAAKSDFNGIVLGKYFRDGNFSTSSTRIGLSDLDEGRSTGEHFCEPYTQYGE
jgi:hypothetical protein